MDPRIQGSNAVGRSTASSGEPLRIRLSTIAGILDNCHSLMADVEDHFVAVPRAASAKDAVPPAPSPINDSVDAIEQGIRAMRDRLAALNDRL